MRKRFSYNGQQIVDNLQDDTLSDVEEIVKRLNELDEDINDYQDCLFQRNEKYDKIDEILSTRVFLCNNPQAYSPNSFIDPQIEMHTFYSLLMKQNDDIMGLEAKCKDMECSITRKNKEMLEKDSLISELQDTLIEKNELIEELYSFRLLYNALLFNEWAKNDVYEVYKSRRHDDGELCYDGDYFIVVANLPTGQITNHYHIQYWDLFNITEHPRVKDKFDGHTSDVVLHRLMMLITEAVK